jgi:hypothetical protein
MKRIPLTLVICLTLMLIAVAVALARTPLVRVGTDGTPLPTEIGATFNPDTVCQPEEILPKDTTVVRMSLLSLLGPEIKVHVYAEGQLITSGVIGYGWTGTVVSVPVAPLTRTYTHASVCFTLAKRQQLVNYRGDTTKRAPAVSDGAQTLPGRIRIEYLAPGKKSWLSLALPTARRIGLTVGGGSGIVLLLFMLVVSTAGLSSWVLIRDLR